MTSESHAPLRGPEEGSAEWLELRKVAPGRPPVIGASDAAAACGMSHYRTPLDLYLQAIGELEPVYDEAAQRRMRRGKRMQSVILQEFADETSREVSENHFMYFHPGHSFMAATPDGIVLGNPRELVEAKSASPHMFAGELADDARYGQEGGDHVPDDTFFQAQQQLAVMGLEKCYVVVMFGVFTLRVYPVVRSDELIDAITVAEQELVERIVQRDPPEPDWCHPRTRQLISAVKGYQAGEVVQLDEASHELWVTRARIADEIKDLERQKDALTNKLLWALGSAEIGRFPRGERELRRVIVPDSLVTEADVAELQQRIGSVKRRGHERLLERKAR